MTSDLSGCRYAIILGVSPFTVPIFSLESLMSAFTRSALKLNISVMFLSLFLITSGCGTDGNTVIQPSSQEPTAEEEAAYEKEIDEMIDERD